MGYRNNDLGHTRWLSFGDHFPVADAGEHPRGHRLRKDVGGGPALGSTFKGLHREPMGGGGPLLIPQVLPCRGNPATYL